MARVYLPSERTKATMMSNAYNDRSVPIPEERKGEMFRDPENPSAYFTERNVPPQNLSFQRGSDLADDPQNDTIFQSIAAHMEAPPEDLAEVKRLHKEAVRQRRISNVPGDLPGSKHTKQWQDKR